MWKKIRMIIGDEHEGTAVSCFEKKTRVKKFRPIFKEKRANFKII